MDRTMLKLEGLQALVAIVEAGSVSAAARRLGLAKSVVSTRLSALETELGARLLQRTTRRLALTGDGMALHDVALRVTRELEEAAAAVAERRGELAGRVRLSAPLTFGVTHLGPALHALIARHPRLEVQVTLDDRFVDLVGEGYDMGVRIGRLADSALVARRLAVSRRIVVAAPAYAERHGLPRRLADLVEHRAVTYAIRRLHDEWQFTSGGRQVAAEIRSAHQANNGEFIRDAVIAGLGIAMLPSFIAAPALRDGRLAAVRLEDAEPLSDDIHAVYPQGRSVPARVAAVTEQLVAAIGDPPRWDAGLDLPGRGGG
jgi:DNA-binding transcriptional LysR family regulator